MPDALDEILRIANDPRLSETGGSHGQRGVDFQRYWAIARMLELVEQDGSDFLLLFEAIQDVAEMDSSTSPTAIRVYQVKKREDEKWRWNDLTCLCDPKPGKVQCFDRVSGSPIGKLYLSVVAFSALQSEGWFVSNAGCDVALEDNDRAYNTHDPHLGQLHPDLRKVLVDGLKCLSGNGECVPDLSRLRLRKVHIHPGDPRTPVIGLMARYLGQVIPEHAGQAESLVDTLYARIAPLGAKTERCTTFETMRERKGYSRSDFDSALAQVQRIPDEVAPVDELIYELRQGMEVMLRSRVVSETTRLQTSRLQQSTSPADQKTSLCCAAWLSKNPFGGDLCTFLSRASSELRQALPDVRPATVMAHVMMRVAEELCKDQTSEN